LAHAQVPEVQLTQEQIAEERAYTLGVQAYIWSYRIEAVSRRHPELHMRIYRTPLGLRVLLMNDTYTAASDRAQKLLKELGSDPVYRQMCHNQH
jgi:hypothetical protein